MEIGAYEPRNPASPGEWETYHRIRREVLFEARGLFDVDDENHADELAKGNTPLLLFHGGRPVGTVRLDLRPEGAVATRLVAIDAPHQGRGHGRMLLKLVEEWAMAAGVRRIVVNAFGGAEDFYAKSGYRRESWSDPGARPAVMNTVQMVKDL